MNKNNPSLQDSPSTSSLRGSVSKANTTKQSINKIIDCFNFLRKSRNNKKSIKSYFTTLTNQIDCHDLPKASLAMTKKSLSLRRVGRIVIARALPEAIHKIQSFCFVLLSQKVESPYPFNPQSKTDFHSMVQNIRLRERVL